MKNSWPPNKNRYIAKLIAFVIKVTHLSGHPACPAKLWRSLERSRRIDAFSLMEVMLAMAIFAIISTSIFSLLGTSLLYSGRSHAIVTRIFYIKNMFFDEEVFTEFKKDPKKKIEKNMQEPSIGLKIELLSLGGKLEKAYKDCYIVNASGSWSLFTRPMEENIYGIGFVQEPKK